VQSAGAQASGVAVAIIAPGAGTSANAATYSELARNARFRVEVVGQSRGPYDRYPLGWPQGCAAPNLESFAQEVLAQGVIERSDCLVVGSRGGQVVLPALWQAKGAAVPPAIVINGGCAMQVPMPVHWPDSAITFLLLGGRDNFRGRLSTEEYITDARRRVPRENGTTAVLYVHEMQHMPQAALFGAILQPMISALMAWRSSGQPPLAEFKALLAGLVRGGWSGQLWHTASPGCWQDAPFSGMRKEAPRPPRLAWPAVAVAALHAGA